MVRLLTLVSVCPTLTGIEGTPPPKAEKTALMLRTPMKVPDPSSLACRATVCDPWLTATAALSEPMAAKG